MKITQIDAIPLHYEPAKPVTGRAAQDMRRTTIVVRIHTDEGITGEAYSGSASRYQGRVVTAIRDHFTPRLVGQDLLDIEKVWDVMFGINPDLGNRSIHSLDISNWALVMEAIAAVDNAAWDAVGKHYGQPVSRLLGGFRDKVPVIGIGGYSDDDGALRAEVQRFKAGGLAGIKIGVGELSIDQDLHRVEIVRQAGGDDFILVVNASQTWTLEEALQFGRAAKPYGLRWIEEPVHWSDPYAGMKLLSERIEIPIASGQGEINRYGCRDLFLRGGVSALNFSASVAGGISEWRRAANLASQYHAQIGHYQDAQIGLHVLAAYPNAAHAEIFPDAALDPFWAELLMERPAIRDGYMSVPTGAGLGMPLNPEAIEKFRVQ